MERVSIAWHSNLASRELVSWFQSYTRGRYTLYHESSVLHVVKKASLNKQNHGC
jgi:hypothetical protein